MLLDYFTKHKNNFKIKLNKKLFASINKKLSALITIYSKDILTNHNKEKELEFVRHLFDEWNNALKTKSPHNVSSLYSDNNLFLPTMSGDFKKGIKGASDYFSHFLQSNPDGKIVNDDVIKLSPNTYLHCGMYDFEVDGENNQRKIVHARFTFIWQKIGNSWKIIHHHSSLKPENH